MARISKNQQAEIDLLDSAGSFHEFKKFVSGVFSLMRNWSKCRALGIRIREGDEFPYYERLGFPPELMELRNRQCLLNPAGGEIRDVKGNVVTDCICEAVIDRDYNPGLSYFTDNGSFWTNSASDFFKDRGGIRHRQIIRNVCNLWHFESAALIPIIYSDTVLGLLQFNDYSKGLFEPATIELLEELANRMAIRIALDFDLVKSNQDGGKCFKI